MLRIALILLVLVGLAAAIATTRLGTVSSTASAQTAAVALGVAPAGDAFSETGTLVFYPNNVGPVPYLFYQDPGKSTTAKALVFPDGPPAGFSSWTGARVSVTGSLVLEHVVVSDITYIAAP